MKRLKNDHPEEKPRPQASPARPWRQVAVFQTRKGDRYLEGVILRDPDGRYQVTLSKVIQAGGQRVKEGILRLADEKEAEDLYRLMAALDREIAVHKQTFADG